MTPQEHYAKTQDLEKKVHAVYSRQARYLHRGRYACAEMSVTAVAKELKLHRHAYTNTFQHELPELAEHDSLEKAVLYAVLHSYDQHYQLVPRLKNNVWYLHCDRMHEDALDKIWMREMKEKLDDEWVDQTVRESCKFALRVDHDQGKYVVMPTSDIEHNHLPSCHPGAHIDTFEEIYNDYFGRRFGCENARNEEYERMNAPPVYGPLSLVKDEWKEFKQLRVRGKTPIAAVQELLDNPLLRGAFRYGAEKPGSIFFAHTEGFRYWKTYPEVVIVEDSQYYTTQSDGKEWMLLSIRGVDNGDREFPICACLTKSYEYELEIETYGWALEQYKQLLQDYNIPAPGFMLADTGNNFVEAAKVVFPQVPVRVEADRRIKEVQDSADDSIPDKMENMKAMGMWTQFVTGDNEDKKKMADIINKEKSPAIKSFFAMLQQDEPHSLKPVTKDCPFFLQDMEFYEYQFMKSDAPENVFEIVRFILKGFVNVYENSDRCQGYLFSLTQNGFGEFYEDVQHWISEIALAAVRDGRKSRCTTGVPSAEDVKEMKKKGRKLKIDDFHPKWRNMFSSLHEVPLNGGKFESQWKKLKTGLDFFTTEFKEGKCQIGEKPEACEGCGSYHCEGVSDEEVKCECEEEESEGESESD